jgi:ketosteroid isomerase-like protein
MSDEQQIRALIEAWAIAAHDGDLAAVLADHAPDIVMFDVLPPDQGVRGIGAYRDTWPPFFQWQAGGAVFEIESLVVTAGAEVAFAYALLRCGTAADLARAPGQRLRLTVGLRKTGGCWIVTHEHHSFPSTTGPDAAPSSDVARS